MIFFEILALCGIIAVIYLISKQVKFLNEIGSSLRALRGIKEEITRLAKQVETLETWLKTPDEPDKERSAGAFPSADMPAQYTSHTVGEMLDEMQKSRKQPFAETSSPMTDENLVYDMPAIETDAENPSLAPPEPENATPPKARKKKARPIDLEKYIGVNVVNKIGIGILVIGIGFFVKYAIDKNWINAYFRTLIGLACGGLLIGIGGRIHKSYKAFSSVLFGGGLAVFYLTISIAFHQYRIFSQEAAFGIMVGITCFAVWLSLKYNRKEIAVIGIVGGFGTPLFVSTGEGNYIVLFTYLLILNSGMLVLAALRKWPLLNIICYALTALTYTAWFFSYNFYPHPETYTGAFIFATAFYLVFFFMNIIYNLREIKKFTNWDYVILLSNSFLYFCIGMVISGHPSGGKYQGLFTACLSAFNLFFAWFLYGYRRADKNFVHLLTGLVIAFISLTGPAQLHGNYITMYWAAESVLLLWLSFKTEIRLLQMGSATITLIMGISLLLNFSDVYHYRDYDLKIMVNEGFVTGMFVVCCLFMAQRILKNKTGDFLKLIPIAVYRIILQFATGIFLYLTLLLELVHQAGFHLASVPEQNMVIFLYHLVYLSGLMLYTRYYRLKYLTFATTLAGAMAVLLWIAVYYNNAYAYIFTPDGHSLTWFYGLHFPALALACFILYYSRQNALMMGKNIRWLRSLIYWYFSFVIVYMASTELSILIYSGWPAPDKDAWQLEGNIVKIGFPIVWGLCAFLFMRSGMLHKNRTLRIISLTLLLVTVLKLFISDISNASELGKIAAFICLGIVLLVISFMYQRIKTIIFGDDGDDTEPDETGPENTAESIP